MSCFVEAVRKDRGLSAKLLGLPIKKKNNPPRPSKCIYPINGAYPLGTSCLLLVGSFSFEKAEKEFPFSWGKGLLEKRRFFYKTFFSFFFSSLDKLLTKIGH